MRTVKVQAQSKRMGIAKVQVKNKPKRIVSPPEDDRTFSEYSAFTHIYPSLGGPTDMETVFPELSGLVLEIVLPASSG